MTLILAGAVDLSDDHRLRHDVFTCMDAPQVIEERADGVFKVRVHAATAGHDQFQPEERVMRASRISSVR